MNNIICYVFGHKRKYYITQDSPQKNFRVCLRCGQMQECQQRTLVSQFWPGTLWYTLVQRTKRGAENFLKTLGED